ncbi:alpha/beta hydrolase [soil metagenome]
MKTILSSLCFTLLAGTALAAEPPYVKPADAKLHILKQRASKIDMNAKEHPEIGFVFADAQGKALDTEVAVLDTRVKPKGKLVIWLMGYNAPLFERVAGYGYHAIQVSYANQWFAKINKEAMDDGVSLGKVRLEAATGEDHSPLVTIPKPDGMMERAYQFVKWLAKEQPAGKWDQFLTKDGKGLRWDLVTVSGSSHGSTTAARFAIHQKVDRVVIFCGPRDQTETWQGFPSATPPERFFGFSHVLDGGWTGQHYCRSWLMLGLNKFGPIVDVDSTPAPFQNSRRLTTAFDVNKDAKKAHGSVVPGGSAFKDDKGKYKHESVWIYLFNHPTDKVGEAVPPEVNCKLYQPVKK